MSLEPTTETSSSKENQSETDIDWFDELVQRASRSEEDLRNMVEAKVKQFDGLVAIKGASILVGRDLGLDLVTECRDTSLEIENLVCGMSDVVLEAKISDVGPVRTFTSNGEEGRVRSLTIYDQTGDTQLTLWDEDVEAAGNLCEGDVVRVEGCYTGKEMRDWQKDNFGVPAVQVGDNAVVKRVEE